MDDRTDDIAGSHSGPQKGQCPSDTSRKIDYVPIVTTSGGVPSFRGSRPETCHVQRSAQRPLPDARDVTTLMYSLEGRKKKVSPGRTFATSFSANRPGRCHVGCPYATSVCPGIDHIIDWPRHVALLRSRPYDMRGSVCARKVCWHVHQIFDSAILAEKRRWCVLRTYAAIAYQTRWMFEHLSSFVLE